MVLPADQTVASPREVRTAFTRLNALRQQADSDATKVGTQFGNDSKVPRRR